MTTDPSARVALITGANKGIGFAVGRGLGEAGVSVLLGCRDVARGQEAAGKLREDGECQCPVPSICAGSMPWAARAHCFRSTVTM